MDTPVRFFDQVLGRIASILMHFPAFQTTENTRMGYPGIPGYQQPFDDLRLKII